MIRNYLKITLLALVFIGLQFSCSEDFITRDPYTDISKDKALSSYDKLLQSTTGLYSYLMLSDTYGEFLCIAPDVIADNLKSSIEAATERYHVDYRLQVTAEGGQSGTWANLYYMINAACNVINVIEADEFDKQGAATSQINQILGEALFMRALGHFNLVNTFAHHYTIQDASIAPNADGNGGHIGVPIVLESKIDEPARNSVKEVYDQIINDLGKAANLMTEFKPCTFASSNVAKALLARVYLYKEDWANAAKYADEVIASADYALTPASDYESYWTLTDQTETIFEIAMNLSDPWFPGGNNNLGGVYLFYHDLVATDDLVQLYENGDARLNILKPNSSGEYLVYKYPGREGTQDQGFQINNTKVIRLAEMYLIRAEANHKGGLSIGDSPLNDINYLRMNRGLSALPSVGENEIADERRKELAFEGFRIFDLARYKKDNDRPECLAAPQVIYPDGKYVYKIPLYEMDNNSNMEQNP